MTVMQEKDIRAAIIRSFEEHREKPDAPFEEANFLNFLMADGRALQDLRNGFAGLKRLNAFYETLQLECSVYLDTNETELSWSVGSLAERIAQRQENAQRQVGLAKGRVEATELAVKMEPAKFGLFLILPAIFILWSFTGGWIELFVLAVIGAGVVFAIYRQQMKELVRARELLDKITSLHKGK